MRGNQCKEKPVSSGLRATIKTKLTRKKPDLATTPEAVEYRDQQRESYSKEAQAEIAYNDYMKQFEVAEQGMHDSAFGRNPVSNWAPEYIDDMLEHEQEKGKKYYQDNKPTIGPSVFPGSINGPITLQGYNRMVLEGCPSNRLPQFLVAPQEGDKLEVPLQALIEENKSWFVEKELDNFQEDLASLTEKEGSTEKALEKMTEHEDENSSMWAQLQLLRKRGVEGLQVEIEKVDRDSDYNEKNIMGHASLKNLEDIDGRRVEPESTVYNIKVPALLRGDNENTQRVHGVSGFGLQLPKATYGKLTNPYHRDHQRKVEEQVEKSKKEAGLS